MNAIFVHQLNSIRIADILILKVIYIYIKKIIVLKIKISYYY